MQVRIGATENKYLHHPSTSYYLDGKEGGER